MLRAPLSSTGLAFVFFLLLPAGCGEDEQERRHENTPRTPDLREIRIGPGESLEDHRVPGKATCFVFVRASAAGGTDIGRVLDLEEIAGPGVLAVRKIEVSGTGDPLLGRFGLTSLPWIVLLDESGDRVAEGFDRSVFDRARALASAR